MTNRISGSRLSGNLTGPYWRSQLPVDYLDTTLTINTWETVDANLSDGSPARIWFIMVEQTNNGATTETIEIEITINGTAYTRSRSMSSGTIYYIIVTANLTTGDFTLADSTTASTVRGYPQVNAAVPFNAASVGLIRVRQTTSVDATAAQIEVNVVWDKLVGA